MQLVLPKGKVEPTSIVGFPFLLQAIPIVCSKNEKMEITVNNQTYTLTSSCTITEMLSAILQISAGGIAVAVNQSIVSKSSWASYHLEAGDQVMLIKATQGG